MQQLFYTYLHRQIPILIALSLLPGLGYLLLGWYYDVIKPAIIWYGFIIILSLWGWSLYKQYVPQKMSLTKLNHWYSRLRWFFFLFFAIWVAIFLIYTQYTVTNLHYIAVFTEIGSATVASAILYPDKKLFKTTIPFTIIPLVVYFFLIGEWHGYVLSAFAATLGWVLFYAADSSYKLLYKTQRQATVDQLTGLFNRKFFLERLQQTLNSLKDAQHHSYLLLIDLDYFKNVNDTLGHGVGDHLLKEVSNRMSDALPRKHLLARLGGDEFVIIGSEFNSESEAESSVKTLSEALLKTLKHTYVIDGHHIYISASIGIRMITPDEQDASLLVREADIAMYEVKKSGRNDIFLFNDSIAHVVKDQLDIERLLHFAIENNEISLAFQPQLDGDKKVIGAEVLARWHSEDLGDVSPNDFIPIAEKTGLIISLGRQILNKAFQTLHAWNQSGIELEQFSINISLRQITHYHFCNDVRTLYEQYKDDFKKTRIIFEITETVVAEDIDNVISVLNELKKLDIYFSMDDFGTGYSSLSYLKQLPIDELKIDRAFINDVVDDDSDLAMVIAILSIARFLGITVVAEGVEDEKQFELLKGYRCELFQGFLFSNPLKSEDFMDYYLESTKKQISD